MRRRRRRRSTDKDYTEGTFHLEDGTVTRLPLKVTLAWECMVDIPFATPETRGGTGTRDISETVGRVGLTVEGPCEEDEETTCAEIEESTEEGLV